MSRLKEIKEKLQSGKPVYIRFYDMEKSYLEEFDSGFIAQVSDIHFSKDDRIDMFIDWSEFTDHNRKISLPNHYDEKGNPTLSYFETKSYPKNHKDEFCIDENEANEHIAIMEDAPDFKNPPKPEINRDDLLKLLKENLKLQIQIFADKENGTLTLRSDIKALFAGEEIAYDADSDSVIVRGA